MPKRIVILCDGTSNEISENRTNVLRLYGVLAKDEAQMVFYDPGVGTFGAENSFSYYWRKTVEIWGLATGWGMDQNVKETYRFIAESYDDGQRANGQHELPDEIWLFGFSRGAYTARVLAGFIHAVGLIRPINMNLVEYAFRAFKEVGDRADLAEGEGSRDPKKNPFAEVNLYERILQPRRAVVRCLGLFDTVGSVFDWGRRGVRVRTYPYTVANPSVQAVRHAVSLDERRTMFKPTLWSKARAFWGGAAEAPEVPGAQDVAEVWFSGVHGDVGGGYPEARSHLAKIPLRWLIDETRKLGLTYDEALVAALVDGVAPDNHYVRPDPLAAPQNSMNAAWSVLEVLPRRGRTGVDTARRTRFGYYIPYFEPRFLPPGAMIHPSVLLRRGTGNDYAQPNIPEGVAVWSEGATVGVAPE